MKKFVITIMREFGSLGRPIARRLSELLQIEYYDRDIVDAAAKQMKMPVSVLSDEEERSTPFFHMLFPLGTENSSRQQKIFQTQRKIIRGLAEKESCIIVGRCADFILEDLPNTMHVYIYAPYDARYQNCLHSLAMSPEEAKRMIAEVDKARKEYHKQYAGFSCTNPAHKDIMINSSTLGVEGTAALRAEAAK